MNNSVDVLHLYTLTITQMNSRSWCLLGKIKEFYEKSESCLFKNLAFIFFIDHNIREIYFSSRPMLEKKEVRCIGDETPKLSSSS